MLSIKHKGLRRARRLVHRLGEEAPPALGKPVRAFTVRAELAMIRARDVPAPREREDPELLAKLTVFIKTFERPYVMTRLLTSLRGWYPTLDVLVADDSREPIELEGVNMLVLPYDTGLAGARNEALRRIEKPYVLFLDDDFVFYRHTRVLAALKTIDENPEIDILGGAVVHLPLFEQRDFRFRALYPNDRTATKPPNSTIAGLHVYDKVENFFIGRADRIRKVGWDADLNLQEHTDFFTRAKGVLTTVFDPSFKVLHAKTPYDAAYMAKRRDLDGFHDRLREKWGNIDV